MAQPLIRQEQTTVGRKNFIINGNFDIWQREATFALNASTPVYTADRWIGYENVGGTGTVTRETFTVGQTDVPGEPRYYWRQNRAVLGTSGAVITQRIEDVRTLAGETLTVSFYAKCNSSKSFDIFMAQNFGSGGSSQVLFGVTPITITTSWQKFTTTTTAPSISGKTIGAGNYLEFFINETSGLSTFILDVAQVQVEKGRSATDFEKRSLGEELALCQRYYAKTYGQGFFPTATTSQGVIFAHTNEGVSNTIHNIPWRYPVQMRNTPTITAYSDVTGFSGFARSSIDGDLATSSFLENDSAVVTTSLTAPAPSSGSLQIWSAHFTADAEL